MEKKFKITIFLILVFVLLVTQYQSMKIKRFSQSIKKNQERLKTRYKELLDSQSGIQSRSQFSDEGDQKMYYLTDSLLEKISKMQSKLSTVEPVQADLVEEIESIHDVLKIFQSHQLSFSRKIKERLTALKNATDDLYGRYLELLKMTVEKKKALTTDSTLHVFRTTQSPFSVYDTYITNYPGQKDCNQGRYTHIRVGKALDDDDIYRELIKFPEISQGAIPKNAKILAASFYLWQIKAFKGPGTPARDKNSYFEVLYVYRVLKDWIEGIQPSPQKALPGEPTWNEAQAGRLAWSVPGAWGGQDDVDPVVVASAVGVEQWQKNHWVQFTFNQNGLKHLQDIIRGGQDYGWLIKQSDEQTDETRFNFFSSDCGNNAAIPYLEIFYVIPRGKS